MLIFNILVFNLILVFITELPVAFCLGMKTIRKTVTVILINIITNPFVVLCAMSLTIYFNAWEKIGILILEIAVVIVEGFMFSKFKVFNNKNPYLCSIIVNLISYLIGEIINIFL